MNSKFKVLLGFALIGASYAQAQQYNTFLNREYLLNFDASLNTDLSIHTTVKPIRVDVLNKSLNQDSIFRSYLFKPSNKFNHNWLYRKLRTEHLVQLEKKG